MVNYIDKDIPFARIIEHKHFQFGKQNFTIITREYPATWQKGQEGYYPINDEKNSQLYEQYRQCSLQDKKVIFGGRLAEYKYYDMHQVIARALEDSKKYL